MEILGIGASELVFILIIAIIVLGPKDMQKAGRTIGRWLNQFRQSDSWKIFRETSREIRDMPNKWMREANMELWEAEQDLRGTIDPRSRPPASTPSPRLPPTDTPGSTPQPPPANPDDDSTPKDNG